MWHNENVWILGKSMREKIYNQKVMVNYWDTLVIKWVQEWLYVRWKMEKLIK